MDNNNNKAEFYEGLLNLAFAGIFLITIAVTCLFAMKGWGLLALLFIAGVCVILAGVAPFAGMLLAHIANKNNN